ncbi:MAG: GIY-YIG nuclease family protein [bacterium]
MLEYTLYILKSQRTKRYYVGITADLGDRLQRHNSGQNISTKSGRPWRLVYVEKCSDKKAAWLRERQIKRYKGGEAFKNLIASG